jgi:predicted acetyltransferase|tara:strand:+ start:20 stop:442 length:423 start_codon:yes stop_codon:yes gene_type:complete
LEINLKKCTKDNWDFILSLRNDFYKNSLYIQVKPLTKIEHYEYMEKQSKNPNFYQWMAVMDEEIIGYIRILDNAINIMVSKEYHDQGIGSIMLKLLEIEAKKLGITKLIGLVRIDNKGSEKIFQKNDYQLKLNWFEKELS